MLVDFALIIYDLFTYLDSNKEKEMRSTLKSEMQRILNSEDIIIMDGGNYIKGSLNESWNTILKFYKAN